MRSFFALCLVIGFAIGIALGGERAYIPRIPSGWSKLNLTASQRADIYKVRQQYYEKRQKLEEELSKLRIEETLELSHLLTSEQTMMLATFAGLPVPKQLTEPTK